jgi:hypothetical protein
MRELCRSIRSSRQPRCASQAGTAFGRPWCINWIASVGSQAWAIVSGLLIAGTDQDEPAHRGGTGLGPCAGIQGIARHLQLRTVLEVAAGRQDPVALYQPPPLYASETAAMPGVRLRSPAGVRQVSLAQPVRSRRAMGARRAAGGRGSLIASSHWPRYRRPGPVAWFRLGVGYCPVIRPCRARRPGLFIRALNRGLL